MLRGIEFYILVWILVAGGITLFRQLSGKEKWTVVKVVWHSALYAAIALAIVTAIVVAF